MMQVSSRTTSFLLLRYSGSTPSANSAGCLAIDCWRSCVPESSAGCSETGANLARRRSPLIPRRVQLIARISPEKRGHEQLGASQLNGSGPGARVSVLHEKDISTNRLNPPLYTCTFRLP